MKKQTAVKQFLNAIKDQIRLSKEHLEMIESYAKQAKEMEKEQHKKTWFDSTTQSDNAAEMTYKKSFEQYYNETYGKQ